MRLHDVERLLERHGYEFLHVRGSHRQYRHTTTGRRLAEIRQDLERLSDERREAS
jgi:predicted RNA binding protein YcfA (HicA-like mRNA interferase family)